jgi:hypothetical protein
MKTKKTENDVLEIENSNTSGQQLVEKEIEMGFFDNYQFEGTGTAKHFQGGCARIHYCSCDCHDCTLISSDERLKKDINENVPGIRFINKLRPVTYHYNQGDDYKLQTGFIAQEVEESAKEIGFDFNGVVAPKSKDEYYALQYSSFVVPLVKAVQELNNKNESLLKNIENQNQKIKKLQKQVLELTQEKCTE